MAILKNERGFTLLEIIMAISILCIGILAVASMQAASLRGDNFAQSRTEGATWAQDKMEQLMAVSYDSLDGINGESTTQHNYTINVAVAAGPVGDTKRITVTVLEQGNQINQLSCIRSKLLK